MYIDTSAEAEHFYDVESLIEFSSFDSLCHVPSLSFVTSWEENKNVSSTRMFPQSVEVLQAKDADKQGRAKEKSEEHKELSR